MRFEGVGEARRTDRPRAPRGPARAASAGTAGLDQGVDRGQRVGRGRRAAPLACSNARAAQRPLLALRACACPACQRRWARRCCARGTGAARGWEGRGPWCAGPGARVRTPARRESHAERVGADGRGRRPEMTAAPPAQFGARPRPRNGRRSRSRQLRAFGVGAEARVQHRQVVGGEEAAAAAHRVLQLAAARRSRARAASSIRSSAAARRRAPARPRPSRAAGRRA